MKRIIWIVAVLALLPAAAFAQPKKDQLDLGKSGAMTAAALRAEPITVAHDLSYGDVGNPRHRLDLYLPKKRTRATLPVIVYLHGGAWWHGDKSDGAGRLLPFVRSGAYAGVAAGYRLSGEASWPAQIHDCKAAIRWVRANAAKYGLDPDRIAVWGRSAGAHLALMLGATGDVPELEGAVGPHRGVSSAVTAVVSFFGASDLTALNGTPSDVDRSAPNAPEAKLIGGPLRENADLAKAASPITYVSASDPPVLIVHGTADRIVPYDQALRLDAALKQAGVTSYLVTVTDGGHGDFGAAADGRVKAFFDKYLRGERVEVSTATIASKKPTKAANAKRRRP